MTASFLRDLARVSLPNRGERGMFAMMEFYLDDSGTHKGSRVAVWGGVVGYRQFFDELEVAWKAQLACPCAGRPPIKAFHSSHLAAGDGEFADYSEAERNLTRWNFRKVILDAGLTLLSFGISVDDWEAIVPGPARLILGSAERMIFGQAVVAGCAAAKSERQPLSFQFDKGRRSPGLDSVIQPALDAAEMDGHSVSYGFSPVVDNMGLQAADLVAHETYQFFAEYVDNSNAQARPHLRRLFEGAHDARAGWIGREQIQAMADEAKLLMEQMSPSWGDKAE